MTLADQPQVDQDLLRQARIELAAALRAAALYGYNEGIDNHFSFAVPGSDDLFLLNPYGPDWSELSASDLLAVDGEGTRRGRGRVGATAFMIHLGAHRARAVGALRVAHAHAVRDRGLDHRGRIRHALSQNAMYFHGRMSRSPTAGSPTRRTRATGSRGGRRRHHRGHAGKPRRARDRKRCRRRLAAALLPRARLRGAGAGAVDWSAADRGARGRRAAHRRAVRARRRGRAELFAAVKRQLDRENPGYER